MEILPFIEGIRTLEIGHGPGHLQRVLLNRGLVTVAIDESAPMTYLAKRNTDGKAKLTRGLAQQLPFQNETFDTIIATFPAEYIHDEQTLSEVRRCLSDGGSFIVLPVAMPKNRFLSWLFKVTGQAPSDAMKIIQDKFEEPFAQSGLDVENHVIDLRSAMLVIIVAKKEKYAQKTS